jgi:copper resistance protein B
MNASTMKALVLASCLSAAMAQAAQLDHAHHGAQPTESADRAGKGQSRNAISAMDHSNMDHAVTDHALHASSEKPAPGHVPPPPPAHVMGDMAYDEMVEVMGMDDRARLGTFALDRLEYVEGGAAAWSAQAWYGGDVNRFVLRSEGEHADGGIAHADLELLWGHAIAPFWDSRLGLRQDFGRGPDRTWVAFGMQGLAPYWFDVSATAYVGARGRTALRVEADYDLLLTQRLVLQPRVEVNAYGKDDPEAGIGSGLSDASVGVRLRYEIRREFAPYVGLQRSRLFGGSAEHARADGEEDSELQWVAGVRAWF